MQRNSHNTFFQPDLNSCLNETTLPDVNPRDIAIILDPDILFIHNAYTHHHHLFEIHPILQSWLDTIINDDTHTNIHFYLLAKQIDRAGISIGDGPEQFYQPINDLFFHRLISEETTHYLEKIWGKKIQVTNLDLESPTGVAGFSDNTFPSKEQILVITGDAQLAADLNVKNVTTCTIDSYHQPILSTPIDHTMTPNDFEIYSDFDGTIFDLEKYSTLKKLQLIYEEHQNTDSLMNQLNELLCDSSPLHMVLNKTIHLLKELAQYPSFLVTQRCHDIDSNQPEYNKASVIVNKINSNHALSIQANEASYLNAQHRMDIEGHYPTKIEILYQRMKSRPLETRPKGILLIDDDLREISKCSLALPYFESLGVDVKTAFMLHPVHFKPEFKQSMQKYRPDIYSEIEKLFNDELSGLNNMLQSVKQAANNPPIICKPTLPTTPQMSDNIPTAPTSGTVCVVF